MNQDSWLSPCTVDSDDNGCHTILIQKLFLQVIREVMDDFVRKKKGLDLLGANDFGLIGCLRVPHWLLLHCTSEYNNIFQALPAALNAKCLLKIGRRVPLSTWLDVGFR